MKTAFLLSGGQSNDPRLHLFIPNDPDESTTEKIIAELQDIVKSDPGRAHESLSKFYTLHVFKTSMKKVAGPASA